MVATVFSILSESKYKSGRYPEQEFCVDGINLYVENNFIDSLGLGRDLNPDPSALKPSECTTTPSPP
jgi:hypothetical protein